MSHDHSQPLFALFAGMIFALTGQGQAADILWSSSGGSAWLTGSNWTGSSVPGAGDTAQIGANPTGSGGLGINFNTSTNAGTQTNGNRIQEVGAIELTAARTSGNPIIGNSSSTSGASGTLRLNGAAVGGVANVILRMNSSQNLTIRNTQGSGDQSMAVALGNTTENKVVIDGSGVLTISSIIRSNAGTTPLTVMGSSSSGRFDITNAANTFTGDITVTGGEVRFTTDGSLGNAANDIVIDGGRFAKASDATTVTLGAGRSISVGDGVGTSISSPGSGTLIYNGAITDKSGEIGSWAMQGGGSLELGGVSTYSGDTAINNGTVRLTTGNDRLPTGTTVTLGQAASANLGTLDLNGFGQQIAGLTSPSGTNATSSNNTVTSTSASTLTLGGSGTYSFGDGTNANSGIIAGAIALVKSGVGTQILGDANTYTGGTTVSGGNLKLTNTTGSATGTGNVAVSSGGTIQGSGIISPGSGGTITVASGGKVAVGDVADTSSAKVLTFTPASGSITQTFQTGSILEFDLFTNAGDNSAIASAADILKTGGSLVFDPNVTLRVLNGNGLTFTNGNKWTLLDWMSLSGTVSGSASQLMLDLPTLSPGLGWDVSQFFTNGTIFVSIVPEPSRALLLTFGTVGIFLRRNRRE